MLVDPFRRHLDYLRLSVTDRCNLRCFYCMPRGLYPKLSHEEILSYEEILRAARVAVALGMTKIRVTGGEPLVRRGIIDFLGGLAEIEGISELTLTTNGVLLKEHLPSLLRLGIRRLNISLDTLDRLKFERITGLDRFDAVWEGIEAAHAAGMNPVKINVVALRGVNDEELEALAALSIQKPFHVRFIEQMPIGSPPLGVEKPLLAEEIRERLSGLGPLIPVEREAPDGPADRYRIEGAAGEIGFIRPLSRHFCAECNRLRLTASGRLRPCLLSDLQVDLKGPLRRGATDAKLAEIFREAVRKKPSRHRLGEPSPSPVRAKMSRIGG